MGVREIFDLHVHSTCSDGAAEPELLADLAHRHGLRGFALTDHDTLCGVERAAKAAQKYGITVLPGTELSARDPETGRNIHLLALCPQHPEVLEPLLKRVTQSREEACLRSLAVLEKRYPITLADARRYAADAPGLFRIHLMRVLMEQGYSDCAFGPLYRELFGKGKEAHFPIAYTPMEEAAETAKKAGCCVILAHPGVYRSFSAAQRLAEKGLIDGIEADYPRRKEEDVPQIQELLSRYPLISTGGTDFHGFHASPAYPIGTCRTPEETVSEIINIAKKRDSHAI